MAKKCKNIYNFRTKITIVEEREGKRERTKRITIQITKHEKDQLEDLRDGLRENMTILYVE